MKKLTSFLDSWGTLIQIALCITWFLWALQTEGLHIELYHTKNKSIVTYEQQRQIRKEVNAMSMKFADEAKNMDDKYGPKEYFIHLRALRIKAWEAKMHPQFGTAYRFQKILNKNSNYTHEEFEREVRLQSDWYERLINNGEMSKRLTGQEFRSWALRLYLRTILLVIPYYLIVMNKRKGILETILAEKARFALAIVFWPFLFFKYPANVIREIRVEAELRRLGDLFRKLSPRESKLVQEIANGNNYHSWLNQKRNYQRGLATALMITMFFYLFVPIARLSVPCTMTIMQAQAAGCNKVIETDKESPPSETFAVTEEHTLPMIPIIAMIVFVREIWESRSKEPPFVIPRTNLFGKVMQIINQIDERITDVYEKNHANYCPAYLR